MCNAAQKWASNMATTNRVESCTDTNDYGENVYASTGEGDVTAKMVVDAWYDEVKHYVYGSECTSQTGQ